MSNRPDDAEIAAFFDAVYAGAERDAGAIPWQDAASRPMVAHWLEGLDRRAHRRALVVAAGLGDDAAALAATGMEVVAFDRSPAAVEWARERHPDAGVQWEMADLFVPPRGWLSGFDLVLEVFTIQSIPPEDQDRAVDAVAGFVAPGGMLVVVALVRDPDQPPSGPPWPLHPDTLDRLERATGAGPAYELVGELTRALPTGVDLVRREYRRPA